jgi:hypothetical protein
MPCAGLLVTVAALSFVRVINLNAQLDSVKIIPLFNIVK